MAGARQSWERNKFPINYIAMLESGYSTDILIPVSLAKSLYNLHFISYQFLDSKIYEISSFYTSNQIRSN